MPLSLSGTPSKVTLMRLPSKPRMRMLPPELPYGSELVKLTLGTRLMTLRIVWPDCCRLISSEVTTAFALVVSGTWMPPTLRVREPVMTICSSVVTVPVD